MTRSTVFLASVAALAALLALSAAIDTSEAADRSLYGATKATTSSESETAPVISSFAVVGLAEGRLSDDQQSDNWCTPTNVARFSWTIEGGTEPLQITIAGQRVDPASRSAEFPCHQIRASLLPGPQHNHVLLNVTARVEDANGLTGDASTIIIFASDAPREQIKGVRVYAGIHDAFFSVSPWPFVSDGPYGIDQLAIVRYRKAASTDWSYLSPLPAPPQNCCGYWCFASHVRDLERDTDYEYQAAWMWHTQPWLSLQNGKLDLDWWRTWTTAESLRWTDIQQFRTYGTDLFEVDATGDAVTVRWPDRGGVVRIWLTSPDWPGVVWTDPDNSHRWPAASNPQQKDESTAVIRGLPSNTNFLVNFARALPSSFAQTPVQLKETRTLRSSESGSSLVFDPADVEIVVGLDTLKVEWRSEPTIWHGRPFLIVDEERRTLEAIQEVERFGTGDALATLTETSSNQTHVVRFRYVKADIDHVLYLNLRPGNESTADSRHPFVCMAWRVESNAAGPVSYLDRYLYSMPHDQLEQVVAIPPIDVDDDAWLTSECTLGDSIGP